MQQIKFGTTFITENDLEHYEFDKSFIGQLNTCNLYMKEDSNWSLIKKAGEFFEEKDISLYEISNLKSYSLLDKNLEQTFIQYFEEYSAVKRNEEYKSNSDLFFKTIVNDVFLNSSASIFTYVYTCFKTFYKLPKNLVTNDLHRRCASRSLLTSSFNLYNALVLGITDYKFLEDIYNVSYLFDLSLKNEDVKDAQSYFLTQQLSNDRRISYQQHIFDSFEKAQEYGKFLHNKSLLNLILKHHEKIDGSGFPLGETYKAMTLIHNVISFSENIFSYEIPEFGAEDTSAILMQSIASYFSSLKTKCPLVNYWHSLLREYFQRIPSLESRDVA